MHRGLSRLRRPPPTYRNARYRRTGCDQLTTKPLDPIQLHRDEQSFPLTLTLPLVPKRARYVINLVAVE